MTGRGPALPRASLPSDPAACPPLDPAFRQALDPALASLGLDLTPGRRAAVDAQARLLAVWSQAINLTAIRVPAGVALEHVADALTAVAVIRALPLGTAPAMVDLGSGAGYPGLPLGLVLPAARVLLVDSVAKKARFLEVAAAAAVAACRIAGEDAPAIGVAAARAEALAEDPGRRGRHDLVTLRAVGSLRESVELGLPLLRPGGYLVAWKRDAGDGRLSAELTEAEPLLRTMGGAIERVAAVQVRGLEDHRLVVVRAERASPPAYPRLPAERRRARP